MTVATVAAVTAVGTGVYFYRMLCAGPCVDMAALEDFQPPEASIVLDRDGREIGRFYTQNRTYLSVSDMPPLLTQAFVAVEDRRFYQHTGVDYWRILPALWANVKDRRAAQGFSTLTMQLARNIFPELLPYVEKSIRRKALEIRIAREIESTLSKDQILEIYLNTIYLGAGAYGVEAAAHTYFGKSVRDLELSEIALLAGLPKAPSRYDPYENMQAARSRRNLVLKILREHGLISTSDLNDAMKSPIRLAHRSREEAMGISADLGAYFVEEVRKELSSRLGDDLYRKGYRIYTTLDSTTQAAAEKALAAQIARIEAGEFGPWTTLNGDNRLQGAAVVVDISTGDVLALVGGRDYRVSKFNRATQARRQPGSAFKPIVYAAAIEQGFRPYDLISDEPVEVVLPTGEIWSPDNFDEGSAEEPTLVSLQNALEQSRNRATVRLFQLVGVDAVLETARRMGLEDELPRVPSLALGSAEVRMVDLVAAYASIARDDGAAVRTRLVLRVMDPTGQTVWSSQPEQRKGLTPQVAYTLREMLRRVVDHGTGVMVRRAGYTGPAAGKTGTTNGPTDVWFVGITPQYSAGVWLGLDRPRPLPLGKLATGGRLAAPVWAEIMNAAPRTGSAQSWNAPVGTVIDTVWANPSSFPYSSDSTRLTSSDTTRLCVRKADEYDEDSIVVSYLVPCHLLESKR